MAWCGRWGGESRRKQRRRTALRQNVCGRKLRAGLPSHPAWPASHPAVSPPGSRVAAMLTICQCEAAAAAACCWNMAPTSAAPAPVRWRLPPWPPPPAASARLRLRASRLRRQCAFFPASQPRKSSCGSGSSASSATSAAVAAAAAAAPAPEPPPLPPCCRLPASAFSPPLAAAAAAPPGVRPTSTLVAMPTGLRRAAAAAAAPPAPAPKSSRSPTACGFWFCSQGRPQQQGFMGTGYHRQLQQHTPPRASKAPARRQQGASKAEPPAAHTQ